MGTEDELTEVRERLALAEARLEQLFTHLRIAPLNAPLGAGEVSEEVIELVRAGDKIGAVKMHHEQTGLGLAEAKQAIDQL